jgi:rhodanese-related sulfurtransferase
MLFGKNLTISPEKAHQMMNTEEDFILLDVRQPEEFAEGHIKGAKLLPVDEIAQKASSVLPDKNARILIYCRSGMRAGTAAKQLDKMGYTNVFSFGGIMNWKYGVEK